MDVDRPQLYYFLLPFTIVSLFIYMEILFEIYRKRSFVMYDSLFFRLTCSQDWPQTYPVFLSMNGTVIPQLIYAHIYMCFCAQIIGITMMSVSRMLLVCHPANKITKILKHLSIKKVIALHCIIPAIYACYIVCGQSWRFYGFQGQSPRIGRLGPSDSIKINAIVICALGLTGCLLSSICYIRIFWTLRKRPARAYRSELHILATSFVLFCALCTLTAYFVTSFALLVFGNNTLYFVIRQHFYAFSFFLSLANPWCLMISSATIRNSILSRCLPFCFARIPIFVTSNNSSTNGNVKRITVVTPRNVSQTYN